MAHKVRGLLLATAESLFPGYFALVMAIVAVSIAAQLLGHRWISWPLLFVTVAAYLALCGLTLLRLARFPRRLLADLMNHSVGPGFFTIVAATGVLGTQLLFVAEALRPARLLWVLGLVLWFVVMYAFFTAVMVRRDKPSLQTGINGAWLVAAVSTQSMSVLTTLVAAADGDSPVAFFLALVLFLLGCMLYLAIITLIFYRLTFVRLTREDLSPPYWINMGAVAITTLAGSLLVLNAEHWPLLTELRPFLKGFTLFFWSASTWWIPLLLGLTLWRYVIAGQPLDYTPQLWAMVFPLGMYTTGTYRLSQALGLPFLVIVPRVFIVFALLAWGVTAIGLCAAILRAVAHAAHPQPGGAPAGRAAPRGEPPPSA